VKLSCVLKALPVDNYAVQRPLRNVRRTLAITDTQPVTSDCNLILPRLSLATRIIALFFYFIVFYRNCSWNQLTTSLTFADLLLQLVVKWWVTI